MNYTHQHLYNWLNDHTCINIAELERQAGVTKDSLRHFKKDKRDIAEINFIKVEKILVNYGYSPLINE